MLRSLAALRGSVLRAQSSGFRQCARSLSTLTSFSSSVVPAFVQHANDSYGSSGSFVGFRSMMFGAGFAALSAQSCCADSEDKDDEPAAQPPPLERPKQHDSARVLRSATSSQAIPVQAVILPRQAGTSQAAALSGIATTSAQAKSGTVPALKQPLPPQLSSPHTILHAGSLDAIRECKLARYTEDTFGPDFTPAISKKYSKLLDVVLVDAIQFMAPINKKRKHNDQLEQDWCMDALIARHGYLRITRPSLIVERSTHVIMGIFLTGSVTPELIPLSKELCPLHTFLSTRMNAIRTRLGLWMFGFRVNEDENMGRQEKPQHLQSGYYVGNSVKSSIELRYDPEFKARVVHVGTTICRLEREVSPAMGELRMEHALISDHLGLWPGTDIEHCPVPALAASQAYVSLPHEDDAFKYMTETIVWNTEGVPKNSGYCFAFSDAGIVVDLLADGGTPMVMVPSLVAHGTPNLNLGFPVHHLGVGVAALSKDNMTTPEALKETNILRQRFDMRDVFPTCNPFFSKFAMEKIEKLVCEGCKKKESRDNLLFMCHSCHSGYHTPCVKSNPPFDNDDEWHCQPCERHMPAVEFRQPL